MDFSRDAGVEYGGTEKPYEKLSKELQQSLLTQGNKSLRVFDDEHMKNRLNDVSMPNWFQCVDKALAKSGGLTRKNLGFLNVLHFKSSMYQYMLKEMGLNENQSVYLDEYGMLDK